MTLLRKTHIRQLTDKELVERYRETDQQDYLGELYSRYIPMVLGVSMKYLKNQSDSQDAVMDVFETLRTDLHKYEVQYFKSWLYMVCKNYCLMRLGKENTQRKRQHAFQEDTRSFMESDSAIHLTQEEAKEQQLQQLEKCIETLREEQQACVRLFFLNEKCYQEVAEKTGYALKKVKSYIQNGKRNLKICLEAHSEQLA